MSAAELKPQRYDMYLHDRDDARMSAEDNGDYVLFSDVQEAIAAWNRRPAGAPTDALPETWERRMDKSGLRECESLAIAMMLAEIDELRPLAQQCIEARNQQGDAWQTIATAPKDGRTLLLGRFNSMGNWRTMRGQWFTKAVIDDEWEDPEPFDEGWYETAVEPDAPNCWSIAPTHWQPLPPPPAIEQRKADKKGDV